MNYLQGTAALLGGLGNAHLLEHGVTLVDNNAMMNMEDYIDPINYKIMHLATHGFVNDIQGRCNGVMDQAEWFDDIRETIGITREDLRVWYSGYLPWWYVNGVLEKFSIHYTPTVTADDSYFPANQDPDNYLRPYGYQITQDNHPYDLAWLTSSVAYERDAKQGLPAYFDIRMPNFSHNDEDHRYVAWNYWRIYDFGKDRQRYGQGQDQLDLTKYGVVTLSVLITPFSRMKMNKRMIRIFVTHQNRQLPDKPLSHAKIYGGLSWPDPHPTWLASGYFPIQWLNPMPTVNSKRVALQAAHDALLEIILQYMTDNAEEGFRD